jgi:hypothetical protein
VILKCSHCHRAIRVGARFVEVVLARLGEAHEYAGAPEVSYVDGRAVVDYYHPKCPLVPTKAASPEGRS